MINEMIFLFAILLLALTCFLTTLVKELILLFKGTTRPISATFKTLKYYLISLGFQFIQFFLNALKVLVQVI